MWSSRLSYVTLIGNRYHCLSASVFVVFVAEGMLKIQHSINNCPFVFQIYWAGPILGGICAVLLYTQAFKASTPRYNVSERYRTAADDKEMARLDSKRDLA